MRHIILLDNKIQHAEFESWRAEDSDFWRANIDVSPTYEVVHHDFSDYPTYVDSDGDIRPTRAYLQSLADTVKAKYGEFGTDFIMVMIHKDNWKSVPPGETGIWGTNYSYVFGPFCLEYCRWDTRQANTFGTAYHERHHSFDAIIKQELGIVIEPELGVSVGSYDRCITHGKCPGWDYIRWKENTQSLKVMAPYLRDAFLKRAGQRLDRVKKKLTLIQAMKRLAYLLKMRLNRKDGVEKE